MGLVTGRTGKENEKRKGESSVLKREIVYKGTGMKVSFWVFFFLPSKTRDVRFDV